MKISIKKYDVVPLYIQIAYQIIKNIIDGKIESGRKLPSVRLMAKELKVNMHTIRKAYKYLEEKSFVTIISKTGSIVEEDLNKVCFNFVYEEIFVALKIIISKAKMLGISEEQLINFIKKEFLKS